MFFLKSFIFNFRRKSMSPLEKMNKWLDTPAEEKQKQVELVMYSSKSGKKMMNFLKKEGYKIQPRDYSKTEIDRQKKIINLTVGSSKEEGALALVGAACVLKQEKYTPELLEYTPLQMERDAVRETDIEANKCLFVHETAEKFPEVKNAYHGTYDHYEVFENAFEKTGNTNAARSAVIEYAAPVVHRAIGTEGTKAIEKCLPVCKDWDGNSYYADSKKTAVNAAVMAKAKQQGR